MRISRGSDQATHVRAVHGDEMSEENLGPLQDWIDIHVEVPQVF
jgi:hypothetical protein